MVLRDDQWERIAPLVPGKVGDPGRSGADDRLFVEAVLWIGRVGAPWRALPEGFGSWNSVFQRFRRWAKGDVFDRVFEALSADADFGYVVGDGTVVRVHQHGTGARGGLTIRPSGGPAAAGRPRSSPWSMRWATGALRPAARPAAGAAARQRGGTPLLTDLGSAALLADKAFDGDARRAELDDRGAVAVIPPKANRAADIPWDFEMYRWRHLVEDFFCKIQEFRRIATRYDKTDQSFKVIIHLVGSVLATR